MTVEFQSKNKKRHYRQSFQLLNFKTSSKLNFSRNIEIDITRDPIIYIGKYYLNKVIYGNRKLIISYIH